MSHLFHKLMEEALPQQKSWQLHLIKNWKTIIGSLSQHVRLEKIYGSTLILGVYDSHWMQELFLFSNILVDKINNALEKPEVTHLKFKKVIRPKKYTSKKEKSSIQKITIDFTDKEKKALGKVEDPELSAVLEQFLTRCHTQQKLWKKKKK